MQVENFVKILGSDFYAGVPDSQLKALCNYLINEYGIDGKHHIIAANEGNATALAAGYHLATGNIPVVYMQNSGEGNIINPVASLMNDKVYAIPCIFIIGWRGEPGVHDEPQHIYQGQVTLKLLDDMNIASFVVSKQTTEDKLNEIMIKFRSLLANGKQVAFVIQKEALEYYKKVEYHNNYSMKREDIIKHIVEITDDDIIISTTGKASRELFEIRENNNQSHETDFLTVGSMGHSSSIALEIALQKPNKKIWIIDGDGSCLMHMGSMALIGYNSPRNLIHIVINNGSHETVGGQPTVANKINFTKIALACGYKNAYSIKTFSELDNILIKVKKQNELCFLEITSALGSRANLGRPTQSPKRNKMNFMSYLTSTYTNFIE